MFNAKTVENIVSADEAKRIIDFASGIEPWEDGGGGFWDNRSLNAINVYQSLDKEIGELLYDIRLRVTEAIKSEYGLEEIYPDLTQIVRWFPGQEQHPHADDMTDADSEGLEWFHHRHYGAIIYLNDNYGGGHTYYPQHDFEIVPKVGMLAVHPGDPNHMHGVTKIEDNTRYTIASFWTRDKEYFDNWVL